MGIKGAIFDMDGTLLDSMKAWYCLGEAFLKEKGIQAEEGLSEKIKTMQMEEAAVYMKEKYLPDEKPEDIARSILDVIKVQYETSIQEKDGIRIVLDELKERKIPMCVASATDIELVRCALKRTKLIDYFDDIFCCRDVGEGKLSDRIYQTARESMKSKVEETVVFEDALHAAQTAKKAGFSLVCIYDEMEIHQEEMKKIGDIYLTSFREWPGIDKIK